MKLKNKIIIVISIIINIIFFQDFSYSQWITQYSQQYVYFPAIQFFNENTGYISAYLPNSTIYGFVFKTTNGGTNWISCSLLSSMNTKLYAQSFINLNTGYICGYTNKIFKTTDGGNNWTYSIAPYYTMGIQAYNAIQFLNEETGYIGGRYGFRAKTTNGGNNWITLDTAIAQIISMYFLDTNYGFLGDVFSDVYKTTNGGLTWNMKWLQDTSNVDYAYTDIKFINYNTGYIIGATNGAGALFKTTNGGNNWRNILISINHPFYRLSIIGNTFYIGCTDNVIFKSTDGGNNWTNLSLPNQETYISLYFLNSNTGYACNTGYIYKTTNGGSVFIRNISTEIPDKPLLYQNYPNPFNPSTLIKYQIKNSSNVRLIVYDILGKEIAVLVDENQRIGNYEVNFDGSKLSSGIYFYKLFINNFSQSKNMMLMK